MRNAVLICVLFIAFVLVVYSKEMINNGEQFGNLQVDSSEKKIEINRRQFRQCEPCGPLRRRCCFPNLCQHQPGKTSKCYKVKG
jgi:hypothetical protein